MPVSPEQKAINMLAEIICWSGHEDHAAVCKRLAAAERHLKKHFREQFDAVSQKVKQWEGEQYE